MKLPLPRRRIWRAAIYLGSLVLVLIAIDLVLVQVRRTIRPGFATTRITGPTLPDGSIDYLAAMEEHFSLGVTRENNAFPLILQALGRDALPRNQPPDGITNRLGMPHLSEKGDYFVTLDDYCKAQSVPADPDPFDPKFPMAWNEWQATPVATGWVNANSRPLALIAEATQRSHYFVPFDGGTRPETMVEILLPHVSPLRDVGRALGTRALIRLNEGDVVGFQADVQTTHRLARLLGQSSTLVERFLAILIETDACRAERMAAMSGKLSPEQLKSLIAQIASREELRPLVESVDMGERFMILDILQKMAITGPSGAGRVFQHINGGRGPLFNIAFRFLPITYEQAMITMNRHYDGGITAMAQPTYARRVAALRLWEKQMADLSSGRPRALLMFTADWPSLMFLPSFEGMLRRQTSAKIEVSLTQVTHALAIFKAERGAYPAKLEELSPISLPNVPDDLFSGKPLIYSRVGDGYLLYSVGANMNDEGGKMDKTGDDIAVVVP